MQQRTNLLHRARSFLFSFLSHFSPLFSYYFFVWRSCRIFASASPLSSVWISPRIFSSFPVILERTFLPNRDIDIMAADVVEDLELKYKGWYEEAGKSNWEFSQMFGEEDSDSELSGSDSEDGSLGAFRQFCISNARVLVAPSDATFASALPVS